MVETMNKDTGVTRQ